MHTASLNLTFGGGAALQSASDQVALFLSSTCGTSATAAVGPVTAAQAHSLNLAAISGLSSGLYSVCYLLAGQQTYSRVNSIFIGLFARGLHMSCFSSLLAGWLGGWAASVRGGLRLYLCRRSTRPLSEPSFECLQFLSYGYVGLKSCLSGWQCRHATHELFLRHCSSDMPIAQEYPCIQIGGIPWQCTDVRAPCHLNQNSVDWT